MNFFKQFAQQYFSSFAVRPAAATALVLLLFWSAAARAETVRDVRFKMGSRFEITAVHADGAKARVAVAAAYGEIDRLEALISSWRPDSATAHINAGAGLAPVAVSPELFNLIRRSLKVSALTDGAFDISFAGAGKLWDFRAQPPRIPDHATIERAIALVDYHGIKLDLARHTVFLEKPGARIGFGAIGKGFATNRAVFVLKDHGIGAGVVNAGGDLVAFGRQEDGGPWSVAIAHPRERGKVLARLPITETAVVTSGDYERFYEVDGKRYSHIIDPKTGYPVDQLQSTTIICPDAELADALATGVFVMGPEAGMELINRLDRIECLLVTAAGEVLYSTNIREQMNFVEASP